jgi:hypothetical protein
MLDMLDSIRKSNALAGEVKLNIKNPRHIDKAIAAYKRESGTVIHSEQTLLDPDYVTRIQPVSNITDVEIKKIGTLIDIYV